MKLRTYNGTIKDRKHLEQILGKNPLVRVSQEWLHPKAHVIFTIGRTRSFPMKFGGIPAQREDVLTFWLGAPNTPEQGKFYSCHSVRGMIPDEVTGKQRVGVWKHRLTRIEHPTEALKALGMNDDERTSGNVDGAEHWPSQFRNIENIAQFNNLKDALREVYSIMVQMEADMGTPAVQAEADVVLASERFKHGRN